ncbi:AFL037Wp [Eremothecium gossypii ATCC 10895]|uniref:UDP-N-acetylglucosamine--dolichyl-phosphate N-acetylglucosaminephosphotransferase n=1 Tax=Eremothecium gossypii (strain ATCC 10895 / CBS 109.51 / FGSC 9923 / NRRL Y-1056) TaxID=284811 RepID=Q754Z6_EREGS|nr:AFL037Wp [Eremothecium gossypii ATCC 10895]AAS53335.1 AFL037Wp [Eremothecium gossypii ATCC 10895]AEY97646.1 FAFL037Wp [Eremothecium gossypii FDAG1]
MAVIRVCALLAIAGTAIVYSKYSSAVWSAAGFAIIGYLATNTLIPRVADSFIRVGLYGKDLGKPGRPVIAETMGAVAATVYLFMMFLSIPFVFYKYLVVTSGAGARDWSEEAAGRGAFPHGKLSEYLSAILSLQSTVLLGVADDLFDLRWRHKLYFPIISAIPLLVVYYADFGVTYVLVPKFVHQWVPQLSEFALIDLGWFYYIYMASMTIFCTNSINILAGINGLEVLQSIILAIVCLVNDALYLVWGSERTRESHLFSIVMLLPFLGVSYSLWKWNSWPARVFVGDTYCYFAGMIFAMIGILGHFAKTMMLFFTPQIFNFAYSIPQLLGLVPCPRHRLPRFNEEDGLMYTSRTDLQKRPPMRPVALALKLLAYLHLLDVTVDEQGNLLDCNNMTLINLCLVWFGPMREDQLCLTVCGIQLVVGLLCVFARHAVGTLLFGEDNYTRIIKYIRT